MDELKIKLLDMFKWFHIFCETNGLKYYALGGTMLGAMRHQGFIPWDDDIDVGMPRPDYERMQELLGDCKGMRYQLETPRTSMGEYYHPYCKLYDTSTTLIESARYELKRGIFLDIFPLDGVGDTEEESRKNYNKIRRVYNLLLCRVVAKRKNRQLHKKIAICLIRLIPSVIFDNKKLLYKVDTECRKISFYDSKIGGNLVGAWGEKEVMPVSIMGTPKVYTFEGLRIYGAEDADAYLTHLYGDWRKLPPKEKQVSHHDFVVMDLHRSYLDT